MLLVLNILTPGLSVHTLQPGRPGGQEHHLLGDENERAPISNFCPFIFNSQIFRGERAWEFRSTL